MCICAVDVHEKCEPQFFQAIKCADICVKEKIGVAFQAYRELYADYYEKHKHPNSPAMRDPNPVIILWPGVGLFSYAKDKQTSRVASEFYINAINVMRGAEAVSEYVSLPLQEAFDMMP